jgi:allantoicase
MNASLGVEASTAWPWQPLLAETPLQPHTRHTFETKVATDVTTFVRLNIFPDGGVARLRVFGRITD